MEDVKIKIEQLRRNEISDSRNNYISYYVDEKKCVVYMRMDLDYSSLIDKISKVEKYSTNHKLIKLMKDYLNAEESNDQKEYEKLWEQIVIDHNNEMEDICLTIQKEEFYEDIRNSYNFSSHLQEFKDLEHLEEELESNEIELIRKIPNISKILNHNKY